MFLGEWQDVGIQGVSTQDVSSSHTDQLHHISHSGMPQQTEGDSHKMITTVSTTASSSVSPMTGAVLEKKHGMKDLL